LGSAIIDKDLMEEVIKLIRGVDSILISSEDPKKLANFYKEKVGLKQTMEFEYGEKGETGYMFEVGKTGISILPHSDIKGKNSNPARIMINIEVDDEEKELKKLKKAGVKCIEDIYHMQDYGLIATFEDPDGNYFQLVQVRAN